MKVAAKKIQHGDFETSNLSDYINSLPFFSSMEQAIKTEVLSVSYLKSVVEGEIIVGQNEFNTSLFVIIEGEFTVNFNEEKIATLTDPGEIIGEISLVTGKNTVAEVVAQKDSKLMVIDFSPFINSDKKIHIQLLNSFYRFFTKKLSEKISLTNLKAMQFEIANRELIKTQENLKQINEHLELRIKKRTENILKKTEELSRKNITLMAAKEKLEDLLEFRKKVLTEIRSLYDENIRPIEATVNQFYDENSENENTVLKEIVGNFKKMVNLLESFLDIHAIEQAMHNKKVVFSHSSKRHILLSRMALGGTGISLMTTSEMNIFTQIIQKDNPQLVFTDRAMLEEYLNLGYQFNENKLVLVYSESTKDIISDIISKGFKCNLMFQNFKNRSFTVKNLLATSNKLLSKKIFGFEKYLSWELDVKDIWLNSSDKRIEAIEDFCGYFKMMGIKQSLIDRCKGVAEEMLMNALYDAPVDETGAHIFNHVSRKEVVTLPDGKSSILKYGTDGMFAALSVEDDYGSLTFETLFSYLNNCYQGTPRHSEEGKGGAGRGLHQIVENSDYTIFNISKGVKTEVISLFYLDARSEEVHDPGVCFFQIDENEE